MKRKTMQLKHFGMSFLLFQVLVLWSCYPGGPSLMTETDVVMTFFDPNVDFSQIRTYAMPNEVFERAGSEEIEDGFDALILSEVAKHLERIGYVRENNPVQNGADVLVIISKAKSDYSYDTWYPGWDWAWSGWGWFQGWGYWFPWSPIFTLFSTGTVFIEMFDPKDLNQSEETIPARWSGTINGLLNTNQSATVSRIIQDIEQCFRQSEYLGRSK